MNLSGIFPGFYKIYYVWKNPRKVYAYVGNIKTGQVFFHDLLQDLVAIEK